MSDTRPYAPTSGATQDGDDASRVRDASIGQLASQVTTDFSDLVRQEIELAKAEVRQDAKRGARGAGLLGGAGVAAHLGLVFVSLALMFLLDRGLPIGWAAFVVGVIYLAAATALALAGRRQLTEINGTPKTTLTVKEDARWLANRTK